MTNVDFDRHPLNLFPTLVVQYPNVISEQERKNIFDELKKRSTKFTHPPLHLTILNGISSFIPGQNVNIVNELGLKERVQERLNNYTQESGLAEQRICQSWFNIQNIGSQVIDHTHSGSNLSGALYINVDGVQDSLCFQNPNPFVDTVWNAHARVPTLYNFKYQSVVPKNGDLIIFPSWLTHGSYYQSNKTVDRTLISFDTIDNLELN